MKVTAVNPIPEITSNFTDKEVLDHVRHYLPNPSQPIAELLNRFEKALDATVDERIIDCPNCGPQLTVQFELDL